MHEVLIVGAGPAGSVAATVLARAGVTVRIVDRATFPRPKLCGDTVNPGTLACLDRLGLSEAVRQRGRRIDGMLVTGERGVAIEARYADGLCGWSLSRSDFDWSLLQQAIAAGAAFEDRVLARRALVADGLSGKTVVGVETRTGTLLAPVVIAADGHRSRVAFGLGLARHPPRPRRWAVGAYFEGGTDGLSLGEMHVRRGWYVGVAPVGDVTNVCLVLEPTRLDGTNPAFRTGAFADPTALLRNALAHDRGLRDRFEERRLVGPPIVLGPLAVDGVAGAAGAIDGLILAGDAAGFIDPMTGDGLRFAVRGGELAAAAALEALQHGWRGVHVRLSTNRRREFASKRRFNRVLRSLVASPAAVRMAGIGARFSPGLVRALVARAGDCNLAAPDLAPFTTPSRWV
jgi:flavin-dependent dehydrogenase